MTTELQEKDKVIDGLRLSLQKTEKERDELKEKLRTLQQSMSPAQRDLVAELESLKAQNKVLGIQLKSSQVALLIAKEKVTKLQTSASAPATPLTERDLESICSSPTDAGLSALVNTTSAGKFTEMEAELSEIRKNVIRHHNELISIIANVNVEIKLPALVPLPEPTTPSSSNNSSFSTPVKGLVHTASMIDLSNGKVSSLSTSLSGNKARLAAMLEMGESLTRSATKANLFSDNDNTLSRRSSFRNGLNLNASFFAAPQDDARATQFLNQVRILAQLVDSDSIVLERLRHVVQVVNQTLESKDSLLKAAQAKLAQFEASIVSAEGDLELSALLLQLQSEKNKLQEAIETFLDDDDDDNEEP